MPIMNIKKIFVVGAGFMGSGIVENTAVKGLNVTAYDISQSQLEKSMKTIDKNLKSRRKRKNERIRKKECSLTDILYHSYF